TTDLTRLDAEFFSNVKVITNEGLVVKTEYLKYDHDKNTAETDKPVAFERNNLHGTATGMFVEATEERVHLLKDVDVTVDPEDKGAGKAHGSQEQGTGTATSNSPRSNAGGKIKAPVHLTGQTALLDKNKHVITFEGNVVVTQKSDEIRSDK